MHTYPPLQNNFDLIRLLAAIQVFIGHAFLLHLFQQNMVYNIIWFIPGVPVFFGMSGFLLLWSFERNPDILTYFKNRFLRLYPALWATMILTAIILLACHNIPLHGLLDPSFLLFFIGRCTIIYSFTPTLVKSFAQGNPNGSLWTIGVELQFYCCLPILYYIIRSRPLLTKNLFLLSIAAISWWIDRKDPPPPFNVNALNGYLQILVSEFRILYYLFFFIIGMLFYLNYRRLQKFIEGCFTEYLVCYIAISIASFLFTDISKIDRYAPDPLSLLRHVFLMLTVFAAAFTRTGLSRRLLKGNDYSYGIYCTHLLILHTFVYMHRFSGPLNVLLAAATTGILAWASWHIIEKRALRLKQHSLRAVLKRTTGKFFVTQKTTL